MPRSVGKNCVYLVISVVHRTGLIVPLLVNMSV